jgi:hypothetical protein
MSLCGNNLAISEVIFNHGHASTAQGSGPIPLRRPDIRLTGTCQPHRRMRAP